MLGRSVSSAKLSGEALNERQTEAGSSGVTANILPPTLNNKSLPHWICSVTPGKERQTSRSQSTFMSRIVGQRDCRPQRMKTRGWSNSLCSSFPGNFLHWTHHEKVRKGSQQRNDRHDYKGREEVSRVVNDESGYDRDQKAGKIPNEILQARPAAGHSRTGKCLRDRPDIGPAHATGSKR